MLIVITICLVIASVALMFVKKNRESYLMLGICLCLALEICGVMIFIAKKGGISEDVMQFLYFSRTIQTKIQYLGITLNQLGFIISIGRSLFPMFFVLIALRYTMISWIRENTWIKHVIKILPIVSLIVYLPSVYRGLTNAFPIMQNVIMGFSLIWISIYLLAGIAMLVFEYRHIDIKFIKKQFGQISICLVAMSLLYILYFRQDPGQVYRFYSSDSAWNKGIGYLQFNPSLFSYVSLIVITVVCLLAGFGSFFQYTSNMFVEMRENAIMQRNFDTAQVGASMFVHGVKNQLLASRVVYKRIWSVWNQPEQDQEKLKEYIATLESMNNAMIERVEELYRSIKSNAIIMKPIAIEEVFSNAVERVSRKFPEGMIQLEYSQKIKILADKAQICEALYNLIINSMEAAYESECEKPEVLLKCYNVRNYTIIEVTDHSNGMTKAQMKKIFDPFYSNKNSNYNWGMGLYYVKKVIKGHLGTIRVESELGKGTTFFLLLPRYN